MRQKIVRRKITVTIPYTDLDSGYKAKQLLGDIERVRTGKEWEAIIAHPEAEIDWGKIEETGRDTEEPKQK